MYNLRFILTFFTIFFSVQSMGAPIISIQAPERVGANSNILVNINISNLDVQSGELIGGFQFGFLYNSDLLEWNSSLGGFGPALGSPTLGQAIIDIDEDPSSPNLISLLEVSLLEAENNPDTCIFLPCTGPFLEDLQKDGSFILATLLFNPNRDIVFPGGTGNVSTGVSITNSILSDAFGNELQHFPARPATITIVSEPASYALLVVGLMGLAFKRRV